MSSNNSNSPVAPTHHWQSQGQALSLQVAGDWRGAAGGSLAAAPAGAATGTVTVDGKALTAWDAGLTAALREQLAPLARRGLHMQLDGLPEDVRAVLALALPAAGDAAPPAEAMPPWLARVGQAVLDARTDSVVTAAFFGEVVLAFGRLLRGKSGMRYGDLLRQIDQTGPLSIPIVSLTCFLIGLMLAYMGGAQLDKLGAQAYIADIVTVGMVRELAGLMTGMILAGRVGAAFAAQLATMQAGEEIDALRVLGVNPIDHLVHAALAGAWCWWHRIIMAYAAFGRRILAGGGARHAGLWRAGGRSTCYKSAMLALTWTHLWIGVFKVHALCSAACHWPVAVRACMPGVTPRRWDEATTAGVVKGLVWIIAAACITTVALQSPGFLAPWRTPKCRWQAKSSPSCKPSTSP